MRFLVLLRRFRLRVCRFLLIKKTGRGTAKVIQQPTADNNWTAIIQLLDKNGGAREYGLEIYWTK